MKSNRIELRAEKISELLGPPPGGLVRYGITIFFCIIIALLAFCAFFRYPETLAATTIISAERPAAWVIPNTSGKLDSVAVENNSLVRKGDLLAVIHSPANIHDIFTLKRELDSLANFVKSAALTDFYVINSDLQVGELQDAYVQLYKVLEEYRFFCIEKFHDVRQDAIKDEMNEYGNYINTLKEQHTLKKQAGELVHNTYTRDSLLFSFNGISATEYEQTKQRYLQDNIELKQSQLTISSANISINKLNQSLLEIRNEHRSMLNSYMTTISSAYEQLKSRFEAWDHTYLLKAPTDGTVNLLTVWGKDQYVNAGDKSIVIVPHYKGDVVAKCRFPIAGVGKIKVGQEISIKLDEYPYMEYGIIKGRIESISSVPIELTTPSGIERVVMAEVLLNTGFTTTYGVEIPFYAELSGSTEAIIMNKTLLEHFISPLKHLWNNNITPPNPI